MLGPGRVGVKAALALGCALAGCHTRGDTARAAATHVELMVAMAAKGSDLLANGRFTAESLPELTYPLERAAAFAADARRRTDAPPASLVAFERLIAQYRAFVDRIDRERHDRSGPAEAATLDAPLTEIESSGRDVAAALEHERVSRGAAG